MAVALSRAIFASSPPKSRRSAAAADRSGSRRRRRRRRKDRAPAEALHAEVLWLRLSRRRGPTDRGRGEEEGDGASTFFASLADYLDTARRSSDFEIVSGRLAMIVFAATVGVEAATGDSLFRNSTCSRSRRAQGVCAAVVALAAAFAWFSRARSRIGSMLTLSSFVDSLIDDIIDGLFYDIDLRDWTDKIVERMERVQYNIYQ
ncbi:putative stress enhanced protein 2, chloroplastic [Iris pallida]|uniref:Stress enhanced protein 2, chloroplastic n=1 Tax=Iris pallida TaxID=29817 RepID=A0AAX6DS34_IRIPA|nr:putative stress enhanced protein 2, chloroplastic [Iris pallida]